MYYPFNVSFSVLFVVCIGWVLYHIHFCVVVGVALLSNPFWSQGDSFGLAEISRQFRLIIVVFERLAVQGGFGGIDGMRCWLHRTPPLYKKRSVLVSWSSHQKLSRPLVKYFRPVLLVKPEKGQLP